MLSVFFSSKCTLFHNANLFGSCIIHILYTGCAKIKQKNNSGAKGLITSCETNYSRTDSNRRWSNVSLTRVRTAVSTTRLSGVHVSIC